MVKDQNGKEVLLSHQSASSQTTSSTPSNARTSATQTSQMPATSQATGQTKVTQQLHFPTHVWLSSQEFEADSGKNGRAASYDRSARLLKINRDYQVFTDMLTFFKQKYDLSDELLPMIALEIENLFAMALLEAVVSIESMPSKTWTPTEIIDALSPDCLTIVVLTRHLIVNEINQMIAGKFKLKANPA